MKQKRISVSNEIYSTLLNLLFTNTTDPKAIQQTKSIELLKDPDDATVANKTMFFFNDFRNNQRNEIKILTKLKIFLIILFLQVVKT